MLGFVTSKKYFLLQEVNLCSRSTGKLMSYELFSIGSK